VTAAGQRVASRRRVRLVWLLLGVMLAAALAPLIVSAYFLIDINREALESARREYEMQAAVVIAARLDSTLSFSQRLAATAADAIAPSVSGSGPHARLQAEAAREAMEPHLGEEILMMRFTAPSGSLAQVGSSEGLDADAIQEGFFTAFAAAIGDARQAVVPVRLALPAKAGRSPRPGAVVAVPVVKGGEPSGVVAAVVDLQEAWKRGLQIVGADYTVLALDPDGEILAQSNMPEDLEGGTHKKLEIVRRFLTSTVKFRETMPVSVPGAFGGRELLVASAPTDAGWGLFVLLDRNLAYYAAEEMRIQVIRWSAFAIALAAIGAVLAAGFVTRPLKTLVEGARRLGRGEFSEPVDVRSRGEIGELADTFNSMAEEIQNHIQGLNAAAEENQQLLLGSIRSLAAAIDEKDPYTRGHSERVHRYAVAIARHMGLSKAEIREVMIGALLHDIGKIGIEDAILRKPAALTDDEFKIMQRHPAKGAHIMDSIPQMKTIIPGIRNHHERWSGGGYPDNLKGEEIPRIARIVQVADSFDAMTTTRPYQRAMRPEAGVARIRELAGIVFDPKVVDAFQQAWISGDIKPETKPGVKPDQTRAAEPSA